MKKRRNPSLVVPASWGLVYFLSALLLPMESLIAQSRIGFPIRTTLVTEDAPEARITVHRSAALDSAVSVDYYSAPATATAAEDFMEVEGTLRFAAGETNKAIAIPIINDGLLEALERFQLILTNASEAAVLGIRVMTVSIMDNESPVEMEFGDYSVREDDASALVAMVRQGEGGPMDVDYITTKGSAAEGIDYLPTAGTIHFEQGENLKLVTIPILNDGLKEANETFGVNLTQASSWTIGPRATALLTIMDNDPGIQFEYDREWVHETDGEVVVRVDRGNDTLLDPFTVEYETLDGTAESGVHYLASAGQLGFDAGERVKSLSVPILNDPADTTERSFTLRIRAVSPAFEIGPNQTNQITILDMTGYRPSRFTQVAAAANGGHALTLDGSVPVRLQPCLHLYPIETSTDLVHWEPWATMTRTDSEPLRFTVPNDVENDATPRFYRISTWPLGTPVPPPTGPHAVGLTSRFVTDPARRNRYFISTNNSFGISLWYPSTPGAGLLPGSHFDQFDGAPRRSPRVRSDVALDAHRAWDYVSHAVGDAPVLHTGTPFPVVVFSHGWNGDSMSETLVKAEELASHGYVVVAVQHYDSRHAFLPDGSVALTTPEMVDLSEAGFRDRVRDLEVVLDRLEEWNAQDAFFQGSLDLSRSAMMGFSWGGGAAAEAGRVDARVKAVVLLDAYLQSATELVEAGLTKPQLGTYSTQVGGDSRLFDLASENAFWFQIADSMHGNFHDVFWRNPEPSVLSQHFEVVQIVNKYTLWFLNRHLGNAVDPMPPLSENPRVINFKEK